MSYIKTIVKGVLKKCLSPRYYVWNPLSAPQLNLANNFGDELFMHVASRLSGDLVAPCDINYRGSKILVGGSTIDRHAVNGDQVWGAGIREGSVPSELKNLKVHAVRGMLTRTVLKDAGFSVPEVFGDPAILLPKLFPEWASDDKKWKIGFLPHYSDKSDLTPFLQSGENTMISVEESCEDVIRKITSCELVITSSLHGVICSEVFGVPVVPYRMISDNPETDFKYQDYLSVTERKWEPAAKLEDALLTSPLAVVDHNFLVEPLIKAFPQI